MGHESAFGSASGQSPQEQMQAGPGPSALLLRLFPFPVFASEYRGIGDVDWLLPEENTLMQRARAARVAEFAAGRACARYALRQLGFAQHPLLRGAHREPLWPPGVVGSITHTSGFCGAAVASREHCAGLGIDAERLGRIERHLWPALFSASEHDDLARCPASLRDRMATVLFSAKEAFFKCQFVLTGAVPEFDSVRLRIADATATSGDVELLGSSDARLGEMRFPLRGRYELSDGMAVTAMVIGNEDRIPVQ